MNTEQNPTPPQGQEPEAADAATPQHPEAPAQHPDAPDTTPAAQARAAQVPSAGVPTTSTPAVQRPAAQPTQQLPAAEQGATAPPAASPAGTQPPAAQQPATPPLAAQQAPAAQQPPSADRPGPGLASATAPVAEPQAGHPAGPGTPSDGANTYHNPYAAPATVTTPRRKDRRWVPVVSAAAAAAILASAGTAGAIALMGNDTQTASLADVGRTQQHAVPVSSTGNAPNWQAVTDAVSESVVSIQVATQQGAAEGSGVVIDSAGHVLTNNHVVSGAQQVQVTLADGRLYDAKVVGTDSATDLAVVQLEDAPDDLSPATLGDSDAVAVGDAVMAVGNPLGLANTATTGIVSALNRPVSASSRDGGNVVVTNAVQTDAAVNPGNSGGPLFNSSGEVIGINSSILTLSSSAQQSGSIGLGFAIPSNLASNISKQLIDNGSAQHAFLGVSLSDGTATADGVTRRGAKVENVVSGSPADGAGLKAGDVIVAIGDEPVDGAESLTAFVREHAAGESVTLTVVRSGETRQVSASLAVRDESDLGQQGQQGQDQQGQGQQGQGQGESGGSGSDQTDPGNIPGWLRDLFGN
ncbi:S1C family serine protease [Myceligenerans indicum]|uniref:S1C family serine protease n=1 Tax=Myceligenerans indicum TaxID=2593663 RepID=UPI0027DCF06C|nr:trypsin-like peptidase domain-containing protein [Myceligenerans indicum]